MVIPLNNSLKDPREIAENTSSISNILKKLIDQTTNCQSPSELKQLISEINTQVQNMALPSSNNSSREQQGIVKETSCVNQRGKDFINNVLGVLKQAVEVQLIEPIDQETNYQSLSELKRLISEINMQIQTMELPASSSNILREQQGIVSEESGVSQCGKDLNVFEKENAASKHTADVRLMKSLCISNSPEDLRGQEIKLKLLSRSLFSLSEINKPMQTKELSSSYNGSRDQQGKLNETSCVNQCKKLLINVICKENAASKQTVEVPLNKSPCISNSPEELIGQETKVELRSRSASKSDTMELYQFDPNLFSGANICCRYPGCKQSKPRQVGSKKEDLYLCPGHMRDLEDKLIKMFKLKGVDVPMDESHEELKDYISLIGILERACQSHTIKSALSKRTQIIQEVCLNMRNVLIIINALLKPDPENLSSVLKVCIVILCLFLQSLEVDCATRDLEMQVALLRDVTKEICQAFGIIYCWIDRNKFGLSLGTRLGAGIGGLLGIAGIIGGPLTFAVTTSAGAAFGGLIGSRLSDLASKKRDNLVKELNDRIREYEEFALTSDRATNNTAVFFVAGREDGELYLHVFWFL